MYTPFPSDEGLVKSITKRQQVVFAANYYTVYYN